MASSNIQNYELHSEVSAVTLFVDKRVLTMDVIYATCYLYLDRFYVFLDQRSKDEIAVTLKGKETLQDAELGVVVGEFANELINQAFRMKMAKLNAKSREAIVSRALFSNFKEREIFEGPDEEDFSDDDPLGIAVPWEEKYDKELKDEQEKKSGENDEQDD